MDPNELLGLEYEDDDLGLLGDQMETVEEKPERETSKIEIEQSYREIPVREDEKPIKNNFSQSSKPEVKKTYEKTIETLKSPVKQPRSKTFKARTQVAKNVKNYPKNDGILPIPAHFLQPANVPQPSFNMPMIYPQMSQFSNLHYNFNEMFGRPTAPFTPNPYRIYDQGFVYQNYSFQNQPSMNNFPSEMIIPPNQFSNPTIHTQYSHFKANNIPRNPKYASEPKATKSDLKEDVAKKTKSSRSRKELDLLLEKRLAQLEKERIEEEKIEQSSPKRKSEHCEKHVEPEAKSESESLILAHDPDYIKKMEEQKRKREEILRQKEEKRNQRIKQMNSKNENIPEEKTKVQTSSDNRIIKATSKRLIALNSTDKKIFDMSNSLGVRAKVNDNLLVIA